MATQEDVDRIVALAEQTEDVGALRRYRQELEGIASTMGGMLGKVTDEEMRMDIESIRDSASYAAEEIGQRARQLEIDQMDPDYERRRAERASFEAEQQARQQKEAQEGLQKLSGMLGGMFGGGGGGGGGLGALFGGGGPPATDTAQPEAAPKSGGSPQPAPAPGSGGSPQPAATGPAAPAEAPTRVRCRSCGEPIEGSPKFCPNCGTPTEVKCRNCGEPIEGSPKFCPNCGTPTAGG